MLFGVVARLWRMGFDLERVKGKKPYTTFIQQKQQLTKLCAQKMGKKVWVECVGGLYARSDEVVYQTSAYWH